MSRSVPRVASRSSSSVSDLIDGHLFPPASSLLPGLPSSSLFFLDSEGLPEPKARRLKRKLEEAREAANARSAHLTELARMKKVENRREELRRHQQGRQEKKKQNKQQEEKKTKIPSLSSSLDIWSAPEPIRLSKNRRKASPPRHLTSAVEFSARSLPSSGLSYQPPEQERLALVEQAIAVELKEIEEKNRLKDRLKGAEVADEENSRPRAAEEGEEENEKNQRPPVSSHPLTTIEKKKLRAAREAAERREAERIRKEFDKNAKRAPAIAAELKKVEKINAKKRAAVERLKEEFPRPLKFGRFSVSEPRPQVLLESEKSSSLREILPPQVGFAEQFNRFQQRALIEPREKAKAKKRKTRKFYDRYKDEPQQKEKQ